MNVCPAEMSREVLSDAEYSGTDLSAAPLTEYTSASLATP